VTDKQLYSRKQTGRINRRHTIEYAGDTRRKREAAAAAAAEVETSGANKESGASEPKKNK
jgi:hypothetical protein